MAFVCAGCVSTCYDITMTVKDGILSRKAVCSSSSGSTSEVPEEKITALQSAYSHHEFISTEKKHVFSGTFSPGLFSNGMGGSILFSRYASFMGDAFLYAERFSGTKEPAEVLQQQMAAIDRTIEILAGWIALEMKDPPLMEKTGKFLTDELRRDLKNMAVYAYVTRCLPDKAKSDEDLSVRAVTYLSERGYLLPDDLPLLARSLEGDNKAVVALVYNILSRKLPAENKEILVKEFGFLSSPEAERSFNAYLEKTPEYASLVKEKEKESLKTGTVFEKPEPMEIFAFPLAIFLDLDFSEADEVTVSLNTGLSPFIQNGTAKEDSPVTAWELKIKKQDALPCLCYSRWSSPDAECQKKIFGRVILQNESLFDYAVWEKSLSEEEKKIWLDFTNSLTPRMDTKSALDSFSKSKEQTSGTKPGTKSFNPFSKGIKLIQDALKSEAEKTQALPSDTNKPAE